MSDEPTDQPKLFRIWVLECPFKKSGFPSLGTFGASTANVVIFKIEEWNRLCRAVPQLQTTQFDVGHYTEDK